LFGIVSTKKAAQLLVFSNDRAVDMEGVTGSIPVPPTIQTGRVATDLNAKPARATAI